MKRCFFSLILSISFGSVSYSQVTSRDSSKLNWEKFSNIFRVAVSYDKPDSTFVEMQMASGFENKDLVKITHTLFPWVYEETVDDFRNRNAMTGQTILFRDYKKIHDIQGFLIESDNILPGLNSIYRVFYFVIPHQFGTVSMKAIYPIELDELYREKILKCFSTVKCRTLDLSELK